MNSLRLGIYNHSVIKTAPAYAKDKHYGALALLPAPFSCFAFLTIPYYICVKDKTRLAKFTKRFNNVIYFFTSIIISIVFIAANLILLPFAYLKTIWHKITLVKAGII